MKLYTSPFSYNSRKALVTAIHLGFEPEVVPVDLAKGEQRKPDFLALNPSGKVPVLVDDDFVVTESQAIMIYLAEKAAGQKLYPSDLRARTSVNRWLFWSANHWGVAISMLNFERMVKRFIGQGEPDPAQVARAEALFHSFARVLDDHLAKRDWLVQNAVSLADISAGCPLTAAGTAQLALDDYGHIRKWFARIEQLDAWKAAG
jgi:glutathione S-transferase